MNECVNGFGKMSTTGVLDDWIEFGVTIEVGCMEVLSLSSNFTKREYFIQFVRDVYSVVKRYSLLEKEEKELEVPLLNKGSVLLQVM